MLSKGCKQLTAVNLTNCKNVTDVGLSGLGQNCPKLLPNKLQSLAKGDEYCKAIADNAQRDLDEATPALEAAVKALESLNKKDITEIKSYGKPPPLVETVLQAVMILKGCDPSWAEAKRQLGKKIINIFF